MSKRDVVFLGGTCGNNTWRDGFIRRMVRRGCRRDWFFNPVVTDWNEAAQRREDAIKRSATYLLFVISDPQEAEGQASAYSLVEAVMAQYDSGRCIVVFELANLKGHARKAARQAYRDLTGRFPYAPIYTDLKGAEDWLGQKLRE